MDGQRRLTVTSCSRGLTLPADKGFIEYLRIAVAESVPFTEYVNSVIRRYPEGAL